MKYKVIVNGTETLCDKVTIDEFDYYVSDDLIYNGSWIISDKSVAPIFLDGGDLHVDMLDLTQWEIVIATNNPNIDIPKVVDEVEKYSPRNIKIDNKIDYRISFTAEAFFKEGYKKSQETHPYSEEDVKEILDWITRQDSPYSVMYGEPTFRFATNDKDVTIQEVVDAWKSQRIITIHTV